MHYKHQAEDKKTPDSTLRVLYAISGIKDLQSPAGNMHSSLRASDTSRGHAADVNKGR